MDKNKMMTGLAQEAYKKGIFNGTWLYPVGEDEFGQKNDWQTLRFGENRIYYDDMICRRI
ncbi:MAG: hypothetical protein K5697_09950 [Lachnospiraceae bacterium]|nr:hypothetical protein [Lachnospiraceae bacterium]